jgi:hypothetical protein
LNTYAAELPPDALNLLPRALPLRAEKPLFFKALIDPEFA